jgi:hypothetical protein
MGVGNRFIHEWLRIRLRCCPKNRQENAKISRRPMPANRILLGPREALRSPDFAHRQSCQPRKIKLRRAGCRRPSAFAESFLWSAPSRGRETRPTLSGQRHRAQAKADKTSASSVERLSSNPCERSVACPHPQPATLCVAMRARATRSVAGGEYRSIGVLRLVRLHLTNAGLEVLSG